MHLLQVSWSFGSGNLWLTNLTPFLERNGRWLVSASVLIVALSFCRGYLLKFFKLFFEKLTRKIEEHLDERLDKLADWIIAHIEGLLLLLWFGIFSNFYYRYCNYLIQECQDFKVQGLKIRGPFALDLEKVFVPLKVSHERSLDQISQEMIQMRRQTKTSGIWDLLAAGSRKISYRSLAIVGGPGSGKSTLMEHLALIYAKKTQRQYNREVSKLFPILLYLRNIQINEDNYCDITLVDVIEKQDFVRKLNSPPNWFERNLKKGKCLVMLDGLDEVAHRKQRAAISRWINLQIKNYPGNTFIVTSRPFGYRDNPVPEIRTILEVMPFDFSQMDQFIYNWYLQNEIASHFNEDNPNLRGIAKKKSEELIDRIKKAPSLVAMAANPLLLTMIATVHHYRGALPGRRVELYAEICDVLLGRRQDAKGLQDTISAAQKKFILQNLALNLMQKEVRRFKIDEGANLIKETLERVISDSKSPEKFLRRIENLSGLLVERELGYYEFVHKSIQEFLAATQIKDTNQEHLLIENIDNPWWDETIRLYAAQTDITRIVDAAMHRWTISSLTLAYSCLDECLYIDNSLRKKLDKWLDASVNHHDRNLSSFAANVKLSRRLKRDWKVISDKTEITFEPITNAEYQIFLDDALCEYQYCFPEHWQTERFLPGEGVEPVLGVKAKDANLFVQWLNKKWFHLEYRYRLPTMAEAQEYSIMNSGLGCWCKDERQLSIGGITEPEWRDLQNDFVETLRKAFRQKSDSDEGFRSQLNAVYIKSVELDRKIKETGEHNSSLTLSLSFNMGLDRDRNRDNRRSTQIKYFLFVLEQDLKSICDQAENLILEINLLINYVNQKVLPKPILKKLEEAQSSSTRCIQNAKQGLASLRNCDRNIYLIDKLIKDIQTSLKQVDSYERKYKLFNNNEYDYEKLVKLSSNIINSENLLDFDQVLQNSRKLNSDLISTLSASKEQLYNEDDIRILLLAQYQAIFISKILKEVSDSPVRFAPSSENIQKLTCLKQLSEIWMCLSRLYNKTSNSQILMIRNSSAGEEYKKLSYDYANRSAEAFKYYAFTEIIQARCSRTSRAWEGLLIVREKQRVLQSRANN